MNSTAAAPWHRAGASAGDLMEPAALQSADLQLGVQGLDAEAISARSVASDAPGRTARPPLVMTPTNRPLRPYVPYSF